MELKLPKKKKQSKFIPSSPLPLHKTKDNQLVIYQGRFNGFSVIIDNQNDMEKLIMMGYFGKANLSRNAPTIENRIQIIRKRQYVKRKQWQEKFGNCLKTKKVIVVPDSDSENEHYLDNVKPEYQLDYCKLTENLHLTIEEAFFLQTTLNCLNIIYSNNNLTSNETWQLFAQSDNYFIQNYIAYHHFRSKNWVVKPGIKFGGDYLLYKLGPPFYHASYVVIIDVINAITMERNEELCRRSMDIISLTGLHRLCQTTGKELLICQIIWPSLETITYEDVTKFSVREVLMRRWPSFQDNELKDNS